MQVIVQDLLTEYIRQGQGEPVLVLHGWADSSTSWQQFVRQLAADYDVIALDLPGFGASENPPEPWGLTDYAMFLGDFLRKLDVTPYAVIGHSNGGAIAIRALGQGRIQSRKLVLLASAGVRGTQKRTALYVMTKVGKVVTAPLPKHVKRQMRSKLYEKAGSDMLVAEHMQETFKRIVRDDVREDAAYISVPTLLVYGEFDTETSPDIGKKLHDAIDGSQFHELPGVGHHLQLEALPDILRLTREFLGA